MVRAQGVNTDSMIILGLCLSNALIGLCGAVVAQNNGFADVGMGIGTIVIGLASVIIGEVILGSDSFSSSLMAVVLGSIIYRIVIAAVLHLGMPPNDLKLFTAIIVMFALATPLIKAKANLGKGRLIMLKISHISKTFFRGTPNEKKALIDLSLTLNDGDFLHCHRW